MPLWIVLSLDSLLAAAGLAIAGVLFERRWQMFLCFLVSDWIAIVLGSWLKGVGMPVVPIEAASAITCGCSLIAALIIIRMRSRDCRLALFIPVLLSVDNLFAGMLDPSIVSAHCGFPLLCGVASALFAGVGFWAGVRARVLLRAGWCAPVAAALLILPAVLS